MLGSILARMTVDWAMNDHLTWSFPFATLFPNRGLELATGGGAVWTSAMRYASVSF